MNQVYSLTLYFFMIHFNIILSYTPEFSKQFFPLRIKESIQSFGNQNYMEWVTKTLYGYLIFPMHATYPTHFIILDS
jgi:hypothetical protein